MAVGPTRRAIALVALLLSLWPGLQGQSGTLLDTISRDSIGEIIRAEEVATLVPSYYAGLLADVDNYYNRELQDFQTVLADPRVPQFIDDYAELARMSEYVVSRRHVLDRITSLASQWQDKLNSISVYASLLDTATSRLVVMKKDMADKRRLWTSYGEILAERENRDQVNNFVATALDTLSYLLNFSATTTDTLIQRQVELTELAINCQQYYDELNALKEENYQSIFTERLDPLWKVSFFSDIRAITDQIDYMATIGVDDAKLYFRDKSEQVLVGALVFLLFAIAFYWTGRRALRLEGDVSEYATNPFVTERPFMMAVLLTIMFDGLMYPTKPALVTYFVYAVVLVCIFGLLPKITPAYSRRIPFMVAGLYVLNQVTLIFGGEFAFSRWLIGLSSLLQFVLFYTLYREKEKMRRTLDMNRWRETLFSMFGPIALLALFSGLANIIGYGSLAMVVNQGVILTLLVGLFMVAVYRSMRTVIYHFLSSNTARQSNIVRERGERIFQTFDSIIEWALTFVFFFYLFTFFFLWEPFFDFLVSVWEFGYMFGSIELTVGTIFNIVLIIIIFWLIGSGVRLVLHKEVFSRINLPRGVGNALASTAQYCFTITGIFLALASSGFRIEHLGILAGALGVGIGFGLQNIVNSWISGLILVFERPIAVGDIVEVDGIVGVVTTIGLRSTRIMQYNGDEEIVPNAAVIAQRVTNRTLTSTKRRYTLTFQTQRDVDPVMIIELITNAANEVQGVLAAPPVEAFFKGMMGQALEFYVNYWIAGDFLILQSEVEKAVFAALRKEGIGMHVPVAVEIQRPE